jgi:hypothetical protein
VLQLPPCRSCGDAVHQPDSLPPLPQRGAPSPCLQEAMLPRLGLTPCVAIATPRYGCRPPPVTRRYRFGSPNAPPPPATGGSGARRVTSSGEVSRNIGRGSSTPPGGSSASTLEGASSRWPHFKTRIILHTPNINTVEEQLASALEVVAGGTRL